MGKRELRCDCNVIHYESVKAVADSFPDEKKTEELCAFFGAFSDNTRIRIMWALDKGEMCVCDIAVLLDMTKSAISHQLRYLREKKLVKNRRNGKTVYYSISDDHVRQVLEKAVEHIYE